MLHAQGGAQDRVKVLVEGMRGATPMQCELALQGMNGWWNNGPEPGRDAVAWTRDLATPRTGRSTAGSVAPLSVSLQDPDPCVRRVAARLLGRSQLPGGARPAARGHPRCRPRHATARRHRTRLHGRQDGDAGAGAVAGRPGRGSESRGRVGDWSDATRRQATGYRRQATELRACIAFARRPVARRLSLPHHALSPPQRSSPSRIRFPA